MDATTELPRATGTLQLAARARAGRTGTWSTAPAPVTIDLELASTLGRTAIVTVAAVGPARVVDGPTPRIILLPGESRAAGVVVAVPPTAEVVELAVRSTTGEALLVPVPLAPSAIEPPGREPDREPPPSRHQRNALATLMVVVGVVLVVVALTGLVLAPR